MITPERRASIRAHAQSHADDGTACLLAAGLLLELLDALEESEAPA